MSATRQIFPGEKVFPDELKCTMLHTAVHRIAELREVKGHGTALDWKGYLKRLQSAAQLYNSVQSKATTEAHMCNQTECTSFTLLQYDQISSECIFSAMTRNE